MTRTLKELDQALIDKAQKHESDIDHLYKKHDNDIGTLWHFCYALAGYVIAYSVGLVGWMLSQRGSIGRDIAETAQQQLQQTVGMNREQDKRIDKLVDELNEHEKADVLVRERQGRVIERLEKVERKKEK